MAPTNGGTSMGDSASSRSQRRPGRSVRSTSRAIPVPTATAASADSPADSSEEAAAGTTPPASSTGTACGAAPMATIAASGATKTSRHTTTTAARSPVTGSTRRPAARVVDAAGDGPRGRTCAGGRTAETVEVIAEVSRPQT